MVRRNDTQMRRVHMEAMEEEFRQADMRHMREGEKIQTKKGSIPMAKLMIKSQTQNSFKTEEELQQYLEQNPQYEINQRFGFHSENINVEFYERAYAETEVSRAGYLVPKRWLTEGETQAHLESLKK